MTISSRGSQERRNAMVEYLKQMSEIVQDSGDYEQSSHALAAILTEIKGKETLIATDQKLSKVLEKLIESSGTTVEVLKALFERLTPIIHDIAYDQYGSHVIETLIRALGNVELDFELRNRVSSFTDALLSDMYSLLSDRRATFIIRTAIITFGGLKLAEGDMIEQLKKAAPSEGMLFESGFKRILESVESLEGLASEPHSSVSIQILLIAGSKCSPGSLNKLLSIIFKNEDGSIACDRIKSALNNPIESKLLEVAASCLSDDLRRQLINELIDPNTVLFSVDGGDDVREGGSKSFLDSRFAFGFLQSFIGGLCSVDLAADFIDRVLSPEGMKLLVERGRIHGIGVLQKMADLLIGLIQPQTKFFDNLCKALRADKENIWMVILSLSFTGQCTSSAIDEPRITPQGCLLMSTLLQFKVSSVQAIVSHSKSIVEHLSSLDLLNSRFLNDIGPGRMLQTLISKESCFPSNMRAKIIRNVLLTENSSDRLGKLASDKRVGAWLITTAWDGADLTTKKALGESLLNVTGLRDSNWKIWKHCELASFSRRQEEWSHSETRKDKAKDFLRDIVGDDFRPNKKPKA